MRQADLSRVVAKLLTARISQQGTQKAWQIEKQAAPSIDSTSTLKFRTRSAAMEAVPVQQLTLRPETGFNFESQAGTPRNDEDS